MHTYAPTSFQAQTTILHIHHHHLHVYDTSHRFDGKRVFSGDIIIIAI